MFQNVLSVALLVLSCSLLPLQIEAANLAVPRTGETPTCLSDFGVTFEVANLNGTWYEALSYPFDNYIECLNVSVPAETPTENLDLQLQYISRSSGIREFIEEPATFPWTESTQSGVFEIDTNELKATYKLMYATEDLAFVCGYNTTSEIQIYQIFTREQVPSDETKAKIEAITQTYSFDESLAVWKDQSPESCIISDETTSESPDEDNGSAGQAPLLILIVSITLMWTSTVVN